MTDIVGFKSDDLIGDYQEAADGDTHASATVQNQSSTSDLRVIIAESKPNKSSEDFYLIKPGDERPFAGFSGKLYLTANGKVGYIKAVAVRTEL